MDRANLSIFRCPHCGSSHLTFEPSQVLCSDCNRSFPIYCDIPDFRTVSPDQCGYGSIEADRQSAARVWEFSKNHSYRETVEMWVDSFASPETRQVHLQFRLDNAIKASALQANLEGVKDGLGLDIGCGSGGGALGLLEVSRRVISIDVQLTELVCARKMMEELGLAERCQFVAASAEALPFREGCFAAACALDVFEHVFDQRRFLQEGYRILEVGGLFFFQTPSRYKWMETHYMLPGLGYLPRPLQKLYVRICRGDEDYPIYLVGLGTLRRLLRQSLGSELWTVETVSLVNVQPRRVGWKGAILRSLPGWRRMVALINWLAGPFTGFEVYVRKLN